MPPPPTTLSLDPSSTSSGTPTLARVLGVRALAANVINNLVGSGIFVLPATVAAILGPSAALAYVACAIAVGLIALCFAEVGSRVQGSGGVYAYVEAAFGPFAGFLAGALLFASQVTASAGIANVLVDSLSALFPAVGGVIVRTVLIVGLYAGLAIVNARSVHTGARIMEALTAAKVAPLVLLALVGVFFVRLDHLAGMRVPPPGDLGRASLVLFFAFLGVEGALSSSGEVRDVRRTVPRAILLGLGFVALLYATLQVVTQGVLGPALAAHPTAPLAATAERMLGRSGHTLILAAAILSAFGYLSGDMLASPRVLFSFGRDGLLPARLGGVHARFRTPHVAVGVYAVISCVVALTGTFRALAALSVVAMLIGYLCVCLAVLRLRRQGTGGDVAPFRIAGGPVIPLLASIVVLALLAHATRVEFLATGAVALVASVVYGLRGPRSQTAVD